MQPSKNQAVTGKYDPQFSSHCFKVRNILTVNLQAVTIMKTQLKQYMLLDTTSTGIFIVPRLGMALKRLSSIFNLRGQENQIFK